MGKGKKPYIDRKNAVSFHLVHRSQHDPLVTDEKAPQHVLVETTKRQEEQRKYGIVYDDDYDYLQHLKKPEQEITWEYVENPNHVRKRVAEGQVATAQKLNLPSSVFASAFEEEEGMLNKAAPRPGPHPEWDHDVVAALDDDFNFNDEENILEDDFVVKAMGTPEDGSEVDSCENLYGEVGSADEAHENNSCDDCWGEVSSNDSERMDRLAPLMRECRFGDEETRSHFTEYSMSSSVIRRNEQLTLLDDRFERLYASYDDPELGDLSMENIEGSWNQKHPYVLNCHKQMKKSKEMENYNKEWDKERLENYRNVVSGTEDPSEELVEFEVDDPKEKKWDCESILSTCSNIYNHPKLIDIPPRSRRTSNSSQLDKVVIDPKTGLPVNVLRGGTNNQLTAKALATLECTDQEQNCKKDGPKSLCAKSALSMLSVLSVRPNNETNEEKRERKRLLKEYRSERRIEKKANAQAFMDEKKRQTQIKINQRTNQLGKQVV